jgi:hypothetical protein
MVYGNAWYTDIDGRQTGPYPTKPFDRDMLSGECFICQPAAFVRREVFHVIDLPDPALRYCMDYDLWIRLSERFGVGHMENYLATSRMYEENKTLGQRDGVYREILQVVRRHFGIVPQSWRLGYALHRGKRVIDRFFWYLPQKMKAWVFGHLLGRQQRRLAGPPYPDGWAGGRTVVQVLPDATGRVTIHGESPCWPYWKPLVIQVRLDGRLLGTQVVRERGPFAIEVRVDERRLLPVSLVLVANRTFVPMRHRISADPRSLAFRLPPRAPARAAGGEVA